MRSHGCRLKGFRNNTFTVCSSTVNGIFFSFCFQIPVSWFFIPGSQLNGPARFPGNELSFNGHLL